MSFRSMRDGGKSLFAVGAQIIIKISGFYQKKGGADFCSPWGRREPLEINRMSYIGV